MKIEIQCARCDRKLDFAPPPFYNLENDTLKLIVFRCDCKDKEIRTKKG